MTDTITCDGRTIATVAFGPNYGHQQDIKDLLDIAARIERTNAKAQESLLPDDLKAESAKLVEDAWRAYHNAVEGAWFVITPTDEPEHAYKEHGHEGLYERCRAEFIGLYRAKTRGEPVDADALTGGA